MGVTDLIKPSQGKRKVKRQPALTAAESATPTDPNVVDKLVNRLLALGIDGLGPLDSATEVAERALARTGDREKAAARVARRALVGGGVGGFVTGLGGFVTMPVALPANVLEFYVQAIRAVGAIASLRGYDVTDPTVRTAVLLTLVGSDTDKVLKKAGLGSVGAGGIAGLALQKLPEGALLVVNKAIGFRLVRGLGEKAFAKFGRGIPVVGGVIGAGFDGWMMNKIVDQALREFPAR